MAFIWLAFAVIFSFALCDTEPEKCIPCKLLPVGEGLASEFHLKASEKGVRLVYFNLKIGSQSYRPLELQDEFLPKRWVWANTISEPMLSLPEDFDILSLGLLNFQVRRMDVQLKDQPSGCLAKLNSSCQNIEVGRMLIENVTTANTGKLSHKTQVVCVAMIKTINLTKQIEHHCCGEQKLGIRCDLTVNKSSWLATFHGIFYTLSFFIALYLPALPLALPDCVFSLQYECNKGNHAEQQNNNGQYDLRPTRSEYDPLSPENEEVGSNDGESEEEEDTPIPVDDASPITLSTVLIGCVKRLPNVGLSFNIKIALMWFCVYPCFFTFKWDFIISSKRCISVKVLANTYYLKMFSSQSFYLSDLTMS